MWHEHLKGVIDEKTQISELDTILGKVEEDEVDKEVIGKSPIDPFSALEV